MITESVDAQTPSKTPEAVQAKSPRKSTPLIGILLAGVVAGVAVWLHSLPKIGVLSALILAIVLGMLVRNTVGVPASCQPGVTFCLKKLLRFAIVLLGLKISFTQVAHVGARGFAVVVLSMVGTFLFTVWLGKRLGIDRKLAELIAAGSSVCGASAVIATNVVTEGTDEDAAYSVAAVTVFGSLSMFLYPLFPHILHMSPSAFGLWAGSSIHEVAQVVAAATQDGQTCMQLATITKLSRVMLLAPLVLTLGVMGARRNANGGKLDLKSVPIPWFVFGFVAMIGFNTLNILPKLWKQEIITINDFLLAIALAAMGMETCVKKLKKKGTMPLLLGAGSWIFIAVFSFALVRLLY